MQPHPKIGTPEFEVLKAEWYARARSGPDGIDDIEQPPPVRPGGDPRRHAAFYKDFIKSDNPAGRNVPLDDLLAAEDGETPPVLTRDETSIWSGPGDYLAEALHRFPFRSRKDRAIARRLHKGETWDSIARRLHVGEHRISRVIRDIKAWLRGA